MPNNRNAVVIKPQRIIKRSDLYTDEQVRQMTAETVATIKANREAGVSKTADLGNGFFERMQP